MFKKIVTSALLVFWASSLALAGYRIYEPKKAESIIENTVITADIEEQVVDARSGLLSNPNSIGNSISSGNIELAQALVQDIVTPSPEPIEEVIHYYYFCDTQNPDCIYINEYVLKPLTVILEVETITSIEFVDISLLSVDWTPTRLKENWGFDNYPAFVASKTKIDNTTEILSILQWQDENPLDMEDLKKWMIENQIWTGIIESDTGELIEQPRN